MCLPSGWFLFHLQYSTWRHCFVEWLASVDISTIDVEVRKYSRHSTAAKLMISIAAEPSWLNSSGRCCFTKPSIPMKLILQDHSYLSRSMAGFNGIKLRDMRCRSPRQVWSLKLWCLDPTTVCLGDGMLFVSARSFACGETCIRKRDQL